ncbi:MULTISPECIES: hypothetical protein [Psychrobacter]|uniref:hypothetical protein n=1 Tax=Psychrobacter TaxID=497 RepID=UPI00146CD0CF|nr:MULTISPECIES: hypothetical protein [Psychrobacter]
MQPSFNLAALIFPKELPKSLFILLIIGCLLLGLASLRHGTDLDGWLNVVENWLLMLLIIPTATATVALPFKYRDPTLDLKLTYYLGMFVAFLFTLAKLRYWH